jgi:isorenieratene synthase
VLVVGGGIAGIAAAEALASRGVRVTLFERHPQLGGRVRAWPVEHGGELTTMSRGFHAFFRQYYNLRLLLRRSDPALEHLVPAGDYPLLAADGTRDSFVGIPLTPPFNLAAFVLRSESFPLRQLRRIDTRTARELLDVEFPATFAAYDGESAASFLDRLRFPTAARHLALEVFARSFFASAEEFGAGELLAMFHAYFLGSSEGLLFDVPDDDYDTALWAPMRRHLERTGVDVHTGVEVTDFRSLAGEAAVVADGREWRADAVVLATDLATTRRLLASPTAAGADDAWRARIAGTRNAPRFAVWRQWLDTPARADRPAFLGMSGFGCVDNVSVLERFERGAADWAARHGGSVVEMHAYALRPGMPDAAIRTEMRDTLGRVYPELQAAAVIGEEFLTADDCPLYDTSPWHTRPGVVTPDRALVLAGDGIRCDYPVALMERAATTGLLAANVLLSRWGVAGHALWTVPLQSRMRLRPAGRERTGSQDGVARSA